MRNFAAIMLIDNNMRNIYVLALALIATTAKAQTTETVKANNAKVSKFVTDIVLNGNNVVLKFEDESAKTYELLKTGIDLKYDETLAVSEVRQEQRPNDNQVYDLQGRIVGSIGQLDALPKGVYIVNGKKRVVR